MTQEWLHGRFVLPTFFMGDEQAISLLHPDFVFRGAASLRLRRQRYKVIRCWGWRGWSWGRAHLRAIGNRGGSRRRRRLWRGRFGLALLAQPEKHGMGLLMNAAQPGFVARKQIHGVGLVGQRAEGGRENHAGIDRGEFLLQLGL